jgi:hypothetical protein
MPIYGLHHPQMKKSVGRENQLIRNICGGIQSAQRNGLEAKPTILVVIGDYSKDLRRFGADRIRSSSNPNQVIYAEDPSAPRTIKEFSGNGIVLLYAGKVEQRYFQRLFRLSTLPPVVEGANSANMCQNIEGKAYLHMSMGGTDFIDVAAEKTGMRQARDLSKGLEANDMNRRDALRASLGRFIVDSRTQGSSVSNYFGAVHGQTARQNQVMDILYQIQELREISPGVKKPAFEWSRKSPGSNLEYELWSDGQLYYRVPHGGMRLFSLLGLSPSDSTSRQFAHEHWVRPEDLRVTDVTFPKPTLFNRKNLPNPVVYMQGGQHEDRFAFKLDESTDRLVLFEKKWRAG